MWPGSERGSSRALELPTSQQNAGGSSQQETLADIEHISTIAGSLASIGSISHTQMRYVNILIPIIIKNKYKNIKNKFL